MGKTDLGKWMITNGGEYSADATYEQLTMVKYGNSTYITLKTVTGITPVDDKINYQLMAQGFDATALSAVQAEDTQGLCGEKGNIVTAQSLVDALADKVINTVMTKIGTAALTGGMTDLSSGLNKLNSNITKNTGSKNYYVFPNGLVIAWGAQPYETGGDKAGDWKVTLPIRITSGRAFVTTVSGNKLRALEIRLNSSYITGDTFSGIAKSDIANYNNEFTWLVIGI